MYLHNVCGRDELAASHALRCFEPANGNGGGGSNWVAGTRQMLGMVRNAAAQAHHGKPVPLISEAMNEQYLGLIPLNLAICEYCTMYVIVLCTYIYIIHTHVCMHVYVCQALDRKTFISNFPKGYP